MAEGIVDTAAEPCGMLRYTRLVVEHDWNPPPLNRCECGKAIGRWTAGRGHECACGKTCNGACRPAWVGSPMVTA